MFILLLNHRAFLGKTPEDEYSCNVPYSQLQSPLPTSLAVTTPGGQNGTLTNARTVNLSDPNNPLSLTSQTDTVAFNGRTATRTYNATTRTATETSPAGRVRTTVTDTQGRVTQQQQGNLAPTAFSYDSRGRLASRSQGDGARV